MVSINTNHAALVALQQLSQTQGQIEITQNRLSTGLDVNSARDDGAAYAMALEMRSDVAGHGIVGRSLERAISVVDISIAVGEAISDVLLEMKDIALSASDNSLTNNERGALDEQFVTLRDQISTLIASAELGDVNLIDGSSPDGISALANIRGTHEIRVDGFDFSLSGQTQSTPANTVSTAKPGAGSTQSTSKHDQFTSTSKADFHSTIPSPTSTGSNTATQTSGGTTLKLSASAGLSSASVAEATVQTLDTSIRNLSRALGKLSASAKVLDSQHSFIVRKADTLTVSIGRLIDADIGREAARLKSLQTKQALGIQALSIANSAPTLAISLLAPAGGGYQPIGGF